MNSIPGLMTEAQARQLKMLSEEAGEPDAYNDTLTEAEAAKRIAALKAKLANARTERRSTRRRLSPTRNTATIFGVCPRTIERWRRDPKLGFPSPIEINGRNYDDLDAIEEFKLRLVKRVASAA
jgi:hypothetical protein